jgi:hypothetical protein
MDIHESNRTWADIRDFLHPPPDDAD